MKPTYRPASRPGAHRWCGFAGLVLEKADLQDPSDWARGSEVCIATHSPHVAKLIRESKKEQKKEMDLDRASLVSRDGRGCAEEKTLATGAWGTTSGILARPITACTTSHLSNGFPSLARPRCFC